MAHLNLEVRVAEYDKFEAEKKGLLGASVSDLKWEGPLNKGDYFVLSPSGHKLEIQMLTHYSEKMSGFKDFTEVLFEAPLHLVEALLRFDEKWEKIDL